MTERTVTLTLEPIDSDVLTEAELDELTRALARELDRPGLTEAVTLGGAPAPEIGTKGVGQVAGELVLKVLPGTARVLAEALAKAVMRERRITVKVSVEGRVLEGSFDPRDQAAFEALVGRLLGLLGG